MAYERLRYQCRQEGCKLAFTSPQRREGHEVTHKDNFGDRARREGQA